MAAYLQRLGEGASRCSPRSRDSSSAPLTRADRRAASTRPWRPPPGPTRSASFRSLQGSTITTLTCSSFICWMSWARWAGVAGMPGPLLDGADLDEAEAGEEVDPQVVVDDDLGALERARAPRSTGPSPARAARGRPARFCSKAARRCGRDAREPVEDVGGDCRRHARVERVVRVADRMDVAHRAVHPGRRHLEDRGCPRTRRRARARPGCTFGLFAPWTTTSAHWSSSRPFDHEQVGPPHLDHEARADLEIVRVLVAAGERVHLDEIAADRLGERLEVGGGRDDADLVGGARGARRGAPRAPRATRSSRSRTQLRIGSIVLVPSIRTDAPGWAPRMKVAWKRSSSTLRALAVVVGEAVARVAARCACSRAGSAGTPTA